jgi:hypothetical protein
MMGCKGGHGIEVRGPTAEGGGKAGARVLPTPCSPGLPAWSNASSDWAAAVGAGNPKYSSHRQAEPLHTTVGSNLYFR